MFNKLTYHLLVIASLFALSVSPPAFSAEKTTQQTTQQSATTMKSTMATKAKATKVSMSEKININSATQEQLTAIKGIGPKKAKAIVSYRKQNGKFTDIKQLANVKGIGDSTVKKIASFLKLK